MAPRCIGLARTETPGCANCALAELFFTRRFCPHVTIDSPPNDLGYRDVLPSRSPPKCRRLHAGQLNLSPRHDIMITQLLLCCNHTRSPGLHRKRCGDAPGAHQRKAFSYLPARRAAALDPADMLRRE